MNDIISRLGRFGTAATLALSLALPAAAQAQSGTADAPTAREQSRARPALERQICVRMQFTGSRLPRKICMTEREWQAEGGVPTGR